jgi:hypothetical protein
MSLRTVTEKIDNIIFGVVAAFCLLIWAILGFPAVFEIFATAAAVIALFVALRWMESRH